MSVNRVARGSPNAAGPTRLDRPRAREWVTYLRDLLGPDGDVAETEKGSGRFVTTVVEAATARPPGAWATTVVRCTLRRPARARCDGLVQVRSGESDTINWRCVACEAPRFATSPISPEEIAGQIAAILGVPAEAASRYQDIFVATAHVGLAARALEDRIRTIARRGSGKPPLILALELGEALDQTATFARCHPREGSHVLVAFIQALRGVEPAPEIIPLVSETAAALVSSAKRATDPRVMSQALCALVEAYVGDDRFGEIASILEHARLGKRATKSALTELVRIETAAAGDIRARADRLKRTILGSHLS